MKYLCELKFGGNIPVFARQLGVRTDRMRDMLEGEHSFQFPVLMRVVQRGLLNAEWLLCGTGPIAPEERHPTSPALFLPSGFSSTHTYLNTVEVQYERPRRPKLLPAFVPTTQLTTAAISQARLIHKARSHKRPVVLFLGETLLTAGFGPAVCEMLRKQYVTGIALSSAAALRDLELSIFGGRASQDDRLSELAALNSAALLSAQSGMGYGEALGRWAFTPTTRRKTSVVATAYELNLPCTVHLALGDSAPHFFPAKGGAELGAALGAASYVDMLVFADQVRQMIEEPGGCFIAADAGAHGRLLFKNALAAVASNDRVQRSDHIGLISFDADLIQTFPALLAACNAVYDGSVDDAKRKRTHQRS